MKDPIANRMNRTLTECSYGFSEEKFAEILDYIRRGATRASAAAMAGIPYRDLTYWLEGSEFDGPISDMRLFNLDRVLMAERQAEADATFAITSTFNHPDKRIATENARWFLERRYKAEWGQVDITKISAEKLMELYQKMQGPVVEAKPLSAQELRRRRLIAQVEDSEASGQIVEGEV